MRHHLLNITANLTDQVSHDLQIDFPLQTLTSGTFHNRSTNVRDEAKLDMSAKGFWTKYKMAFFGVRVPYVPYLVMMPWKEIILFDDVIKQA